MHPMVVVEICIGVAMAGLALIVWALFRGAAGFEEDHTFRRMQEWDDD